MHAFSCPCGGFPSIRHNEVWDLTASLLSEVCCDVGFEPRLQPLDHEPLQYTTANREDGAHLDVARNFGGRISSVCSLMVGCLTLLHIPILTFHCRDVIMFMSSSGVTRSMVTPGPETEVIGKSGSGGLGLLNFTCPENFLKL